MTQLESMVQGEMKRMLAAGNVQEAKRSMLVVADVLNTPRAETGSEERRKVRRSPYEMLYKRQSIMLICFQAFL